MSLKLRTNFVHTQCLHHEIVHSKIIGGKSARCMKCSVAYESGSEGNVVYFTWLGHLWLALAVPNIGENKKHLKIRREKNIIVHNSTRWCQDKSSNFDQIKLFSVSYRTIGYNFFRILRQILINSSRLSWSLLAHNPLHASQGCLVLFTIEFQDIPFRLPLNSLRSFPFGTHITNTNGQASLI